MQYKPFFWVLLGTAYRQSQTTRQCEL